MPGREITPAQSRKLAKLQQDFLTMDDDRASLFVESLRVKRRRKATPVVLKEPKAPKPPKAPKAPKVAKLRKSKTKTNIEIERNEDGEIERVEVTEVSEGDDHEEESGQEEAQDQSETEAREEGEEGQENQEAQIRPQGKKVSALAEKIQNLSPEERARIRASLDSEEA